MANGASKSRRWIRRIIWVALCLLAACLVATIVYLATYSRPSEHALSCLESGNGVTVTELEGGDYAFIPEDAPDSMVGLVFYPGGKVGYKAYSPLARACAENGIAVVLLRVPGNLAFFDVDAANDAMSQLPDIERWYVGGHSLGGVAASLYASENLDSLSGLVLLSSYSTKDLSQDGFDVLSVRGTQDGVLSMESYLDAIGNYNPEHWIELVIEGGNHAQFGCYGEQKGDGAPGIEEDEQISSTAQAILEFVGSKDSE